MSICHTGRVAHPHPSCHVSKLWVLPSPNLIYFPNCPCPVPGCSSFLFTITEWHWPPDTLWWLIVTFSGPRAMDMISLSALITAQCTFLGEIFLWQMNAFLHSLSYWWEKDFLPTCLTNKSSDPWVKPLKYSFLRNKRMKHFKLLCLRIQHSWTLQNKMKKKIAFTYRIQNHGYHTSKIGCWSISFSYYCIFLTF